MQLTTKYLDDGITTFKYSLSVPCLLLCGPLTVTPLSVSPHPHRKFYFVLFSLSFSRIFVVLVNMFYFFEGMSSEDWWLTMCTNRISVHLWNSLYENRSIQRISLHNLNVKEARAFNRVWSCVDIDHVYLIEGSKARCSRSHRLLNNDNRTFKYILDDNDWTHLPFQSVSWHVILVSSVFIHDTRYSPVI